MRAIQAIGVAAALGGVVVLAGASVLVLRVLARRRASRASQDADVR